MSADHFRLLQVALLWLLSASVSVSQAQATMTVTVQAGEAGKAISPDLIGVFFEDLNHAGDGGLYAELIQNRSFEYRASEQPSWNNLSFWSLTKTAGSNGGVAIEEASPVHPNNPRIHPRPYRSNSRGRGDYRGLQT